MNVSDFDFDLPEGLIAQAPAERGTSKLLVLHKSSGGEIEHTAIPASLSFCAKAIFCSSTTPRFFRRGCWGRACRAVDPSSACYCPTLTKTAGTRSCIRDRSSSPVERVISAARARSTRRNPRAALLWAPDDSSSGPKRCDVSQDVIDEMGTFRFHRISSDATRPRDREQYQTVYARVTRLGCGADCRTPFHAGASGHACDNGRRT